MKKLKDILFWSFIIFCVINVINTLRNLIYAYTLKIPKWGGDDILNKKNKIYKREAIKSLFLFIILLIL